MSQDDPLRIRRRNLPHWELAGSVYFLTFRVARGQLTPDERTIVLDHVRAGDGRFYTLFAAVVMPDHVHLIVEPAPGVALAQMTKGIKGVAARLLNAARGTYGALWQDESFDRILRSHDEFVAKWDYIHQNPEASGLIDRTTDYAWLYLRPE